MLTVTFMDCSARCPAIFTERTRRVSREVLSRDRGGEWRYERVPR